MAGMLAALVGSTVWLLVATWFRLPVSTTHSIVGGISPSISSLPIAYVCEGIIGFTILEKGVHALNWQKIAFVASSWIVSPLMGIYISLPFSR